MTRPAAPAQEEVAATLEMKLTWLGRLIWNCPIPLPGIRLIPADWLGKLERKPAALLRGDRS